MLTVSRVRLVVLAMLAAISLPGCGNDEVVLEKINEARRHLQLSENDEALSVLNLDDDTDAPPEYRYLKSITLYRLGRTEAAGSEIARAIEAAPENSKYIGMQILLRLMARDKEAMDQLVQLNEKYAAVAAVAFFATYGFHAKANVLNQAGKPKAASYNTERSRQTLATAMTLRNEIAEFHPDLFRLAMMQEQYQPAREIIDGLLELDPQSASLKMEKVKVLTLLKESDTAADIAGELYVEDGKKEDLGEFYAAVLSQATGTKKQDEAFAELVRRFGRNTQVASKYAIYLARTSRLALAETHLEKAIGQQQSAEGKEALAFVAITLPLEGNASDMAETRLRQYRTLLKDPLLIEYFEARILYNRKQYRESITRMLKIVEMSRKQGPGSQVMATEALVWIKRILADQLIAQQMQKAMDAASRRRELLDTDFGTGTETQTESPSSSKTPSVGEKTPQGKSPPPEAHPKNPAEAPRQNS